jgi:hypothetical protein
MNAQWRCPTCGPVDPLSVAPQVSEAVLTGVVDRVRRHDGLTEPRPGTRPTHEDPVPLWCPWPLPTGWMVTGVAWAGDDRRSPRATALTVSGPAPFSAGPADIVFVAEQLGVGLGGGLGGLGDAGPAIDAGPGLPEAVAHTPPHAKVRADGHPTPLWAVPSGPGRSVHVGEARAMWLYVIGWPAPAAYLLADGIRLHDLVESVPAELVYGADSGRLRPQPSAPDGPRGTAGPLGSRSTIGQSGHPDQPGSPSWGSFGERINGPG